MDCRKTGSVLIILLFILLFHTSTYAESSGSLRGNLIIDTLPAEGAVVYLRDLNQPPAPVSPMPITIRQEMFKFKPKFSIVTVGSTVTFQNDDFEMHNIKSDSPGNRFDLGLQIPGRSRKVVLKKPGGVDLRCRIHSDMKGMVFVSPSPFFMLIESDGKFAFSGVPAGDYEIEVWHPERSAPDQKPKGLAVRIGAWVTTIDLDWEGNVLTRKNP
ncbi:MAG: carboxypeptidase regulatory-like domain-containing protein [Candidatus Manganitrophus sp. SB1]|nr:carboxypeptidase regulatory-like domain-containing protein [Candidatus Manganitrophus morganii]